jgi:hypothetical protein
MAELYFFVSKDKVQDVFDLIKPFKSYIIQLHKKIFLHMEESKWLNSIFLFPKIKYKMLLIAALNYRSGTTVKSLCRKQPEAEKF